MARVRTREPRRRHGERTSRRVSPAPLALPRREAFEPFELGLPDPLVSGQASFLILFVFALAFATIRIGDLGVRVATTHIQDGPVMWSWLLADPARFRGDIIETYGVAWA